MRKEYIFIAALVLLAGVLFGWGSGAGLALQGAIRGATGPASAVANLMPPLGAVAVYSQYPLNIKNELSVAAGAADGIQAGDAALVDGFLIGLVAQTFEHSALVQTVFDGRFQMPVRIGAADALLRGGNDPTLTLIAADAAVNEGDAVHSAASGLPYGLPLGTLRGLHDAGDKVFREASLQAPYNPGNLQYLTILSSSGR